MMKKAVLRFFSTSWPFFLIGFVWILVVLTNYTPNTWLIGWDNLLLEIDLKLNLYRSFFAVWQNYQGLGLLGGIAHASELTRQLILVPFSLLLPMSVIRYAWTFLMLLIGPIGAYLLLKELFYKDTKSVTFSSQLVLLTGALFYLFNLATVQYFFVPLEAFSSFYGFLPWLLFAILRYFHHPKTSRLLQYAGISLLATSAFHVQTLFVTFGIVFAFLCLEEIVRNKRKGLKSVLKIGITTFIVNSFWLLPVAYFTVTNSGATVLSKQNLISTPETQLQNQAAGSIQNIVQLKGYWFDLTDFDTNTRTTVYMFEQWKQHIDQPLITSLMFLIFYVVIIGFLLLLLKKRTPFSSAFFVILIFSFCMLSAGNGFLGIFFNLLETSLPLFGQIFRVAFTKWSMVTALCYSVGITGFFFVISDLVKQNKVVITGLAIAIGTIFLAVTTPIFSGQLIYDRVQLKVPADYFGLFTFLKQYPPEKKILHLPIHSFWGWQFNTWGYRGSGFLWYGVEQPIVDRNFDVWSSANEQLFHQLDTAFIHNDTQQLSEIVSKYEISLALVDNSILTENSSNKNISPYSSEMIEAIDGKLVWQSGFLKLYELPISSQTQTAVELKNDLPRTLRKDFGYHDFNNYFQSNNSPTSIRYPFLNFDDNTSARFKLENNVLMIEAIIPENKQNSTLEIPARKVGENYTTNAHLIYQGNEFEIFFENQTRFKIGELIFELPQLPPITGTTSENFKSLTVTISDQTFTLKQNSQLQSVPLNLVVGEPIVIDLIDSNKIYQENGEDFVLATDVQTKAESTVWQNLLTPSKFDIPSGENKISAIISAQPLSFNLQEWGFQHNCDNLKRGTVEKQKNTSSVHYKADKFATLCDGFSLSNLSNFQDHVIVVESKNLKGNRLRFYVENLSNFHTELDEIVINDQQFFSLFRSPNLENNGYYLTLMTKSLGQLSENQVSNIQIFPLNLDQLLNSKLTTDNFSEKQSYEVSTQKNIGNFLLFDSLEPSDNELLTLSQSFEPGWIAFPSWKFWEQYEHVKYNGWANGWIINTETKEVTVFYWPQLLEFLGFGLLSVGLITLIISSRKRR